MIRNITRSLSARLLGVFLLASLAYALVASYALDIVARAGPFREVAAAHMTLHVDYVLNDLGLPPRIERAQAIVARVPVPL